MDYEGDYRKEKNKRGNALKLKLQIQLIREGKYMAWHCNDRGLQSTMKNEKND